MNINHILGIPEEVKHHLENINAMFEQGKYNAEYLHEQILILEWQLELLAISHLARDIQLLPSNKRSMKREQLIRRLLLMSHQVNTVVAAGKWHNQTIAERVCDALAELVQITAR
ncbi:hypothetical protein [Vibrio rotiferianus]|uniref:hypothetical protein n=1 Tax=Vibrio rotiferianus TaxID=190895 RepID=UPI0002376E63|nr:hypothetical protein [Vibrio rotiferianus]